MPVVVVLFLIWTEIASSAFATDFQLNVRQSGAMGFGEDGVNFPSFPSIAGSGFSGLGRGIDINTADFNAHQFSQYNPYNNIGDTMNYIPGTSYRYGNAIPNSFVDPLHRNSRSYILGSLGNQIYNQPSFSDGFPSGGLFPPVSMSSPFESDREEFSTLGSAGFGDRINYPGIARIHQTTVIPGDDGVGFPTFGTVNPFMPGMSDGRLGLTDSTSFGGLPNTGIVNGPGMTPFNQQVSGFSGTGRFPSSVFKGSGIFGKKRSGIY